MMDGIKENYGEIIDFVKNTQSGFPHTFLDKSALEVSDEEREIILEKLYKEPGYGIWFGNFYDLFTNKEANILVSKFIEKKIRQRVNDQQIADKLIPKNHGFGTKRVPLESGYYEVFNQNNVHLIDIHEDPIVKILPNGIRTGSRDHELDIIIYATGFDGITGALDKIEIVGKNGDSLKEVWADGPSTYLGLQVSGFPNFFTLVAAHNGAGFCNIPICGQMQVEWIDKMLRHMKQHSLEFVEPSVQAENEWTEEVCRLMEKTLLGQTDSWFMGINSNVAGKNKRRALVYVGGSVRYRETCEAIERDGYKGFLMR
jgi:cyclohexanone monooxygenase